ncbi:MAG: glycosyltransferase [Candidatus Cloacimonetes bacterium]|nr:glycosyltransferase [Candidatus Cloacimonadota bacterium]
MKVTFVSTVNPEPVSDDFHLRNFHPFLEISPIELNSTKKIDSLYRSRDPRYLSMLKRYASQFSDTETLVCSQMNPFHPEWLKLELGQTIKVLGLVDDPVVTYSCTLPSLFAFDAAFYVSPSYSSDLSMPDLLELNGIKQHTWMPLSQVSKSSPGVSNVLNSLDNRTKPGIYVGGFYYEKLERLARLKANLGSSLQIYGKWPKMGFSGALAPLRGTNVWFPYRVTPLSAADKIQTYLDYKIGINLHFNEGRETGNLRCYETTAYGLMLLCDKASMNSHELIYEPGEEAVYFESMEEAADLTRYFLKHDEQRIRVAKSGHLRFLNSYDSTKVMQTFLSWCLKLKLRAQTDL